MMLRLFYSSCLEIGIVGPGIDRDRIDFVQQWLRGCMMKEENYEMVVLSLISLTLFCLYES